MTALYIILGIVLFFLLILSINIKISYTIDNKDAAVFLWIGPVKIKLFPKKKKKPNYKKLAKRLRKRKISKITFSEKKKKESSSPSLNVKEILSDLHIDSVINEISKSTKNPELTKMLLSSVKEFTIQFRKRLSVSIQYAHLAIETKEAGDTCIKVGIVSQGVSYFLEFLNVFTRLTPVKEGTISVIPVFDGSGSSFCSAGKLQIRVSGILSSLIISLFKSITKNEQYNTIPATGKETKK